jgi:hypothetical protein
MLISLCPQFKLQREQRLATFPTDLFKKFMDQIPKDSSEFPIVVQPIVVQPGSEIPIPDIKWMREASMSNGQHRFQRLPKATSSTKAEATKELNLQE